MRVPIKAQWEHLYKSIKKLELEIAQTDLPIPTHQMCKLLIAGEDHRFYQHPGVDLFALCRAFWKTSICGIRQGGSTIAMQLVRAVTGRNEQTLSRKIIEIYFAIRITRYVSRDRLPILYLWVAYYGWRMNNFQQACTKLDIDPKSINVFEAAKLVARIKYPEPRECSTEHYAKILRRARHLIRLYDNMSKSLTRCQESHNETF